MKRSYGIICAALAMFVSAGYADPGPGAVGGRKIDVQQQLRFKRKLLLGSSESLLATISENRNRWDQLPPEQQRLLRNRAYAFRNADPKTQEQVLKAYAKFLRLSGRHKQLYRQRAQWLKQVMDRLSDQDRARLLKLSPADRARELLRLKKQMEAEKAPADAPTTRPADATVAPEPTPK